MLGTQNLWLFIVSGLLLNIAPGPDSLLVMSRSAMQGWRAGFVATWGIGSGVGVHIVAAALGLSALLATSAMAFTAVKVVGAAYLVWMGVGMLLRRARRTTSGATGASVESRLAVSGPATSAKAIRYTDIYLQGFLTNVLNPKVALFFLAFVPQFIAPGAASKPLAFLVLGAIFNVNGMLWCHSLALFTAFASSRLALNATWASGLHRAMGAVFVALGVKLALASR
jgi:threonine/homoserine/homoserine lactone efflux protein